MEILKQINKTVKNKQILRFIGGVGFLCTGLYLICEYCGHNGWDQCQKFIHDCYPEEYAILTEKIAEECNKHNAKKES